MSEETATRKTPPTKLKPMARMMNLRADGAPSLDKEARTLTFTFSSEMPVDQWFGTEILSHASGAARLDRLNNSAPLLYNHNRDDILGVVESARIGGGKGITTIRFGKDERGEWAMQQVDDRILVNVSCLYRIYKIEEDIDEETYTATDWEPYEISLVTIPADISVGVGRSATNEEMDVIVTARSSSATGDNPAAAAAPSDGDTMKRKHIKQDPAESAGSAGGAASIAVDPNKILEQERQRVAEIEAMCESHKIAREAVQKMIREGTDVPTARGLVLNELAKRSSDTKPVSFGLSPSPDLTPKEKANYSMIRAINAAINKDWKGAGFELEVSREIGKRTNKESSQGFFIPTNIDFAMRMSPQQAALQGMYGRAAYAVGASSTGGALVATNLLAGQFIELLRNKARVLQLGATVLSGLIGNVNLPRQITGTATGWVTEGGTISEAEGTFDTVALSLKTIATKSMISRNMLLQSTPDIEMLVRADLIAQLALGIDLAALSGAGSSGVPTGIANTSGIGSVIGGTNGAAITIDHLIDLETQVMSANAPDDSLAYIGNAKTIGAMKKLKSSTGQYLWQSNTFGQGMLAGTPGEINGYPAARSNQARSTLTKGTSSGICSEIFFGNWSELVMGEWGVLEILPNPYETTAYNQGAVLIRAMQSIDLATRHAVSFAVMSDALT